MAIPPPRIHSPRICMRPSRRRHHRFLFYCCKYFINPSKTWRGKTFTRVCFWLQSQPSHHSFCFCVYSLEQTKQKDYKLFSFRQIKIMNIVSSFYFLKLIWSSIKKHTWLVELGFVSQIPKLNEQISDMLEWIQTTWSSNKCNRKWQNQYYHNFVIKSINNQSYLL